MSLPTNHKNNSQHSYRSRYPAGFNLLKKSQLLKPTTTTTAQPTTTTSLQQQMPEPPLTTTAQTRLPLKRKHTDELRNSADFSKNSVCTLKNDFLCQATAMTVFQDNQKIRQSYDTDSTYPKFLKP